MIELLHVTKEYPSAEGPVTALEDISLTVEDGDIYGIIGLSGAGKSTLVRCINLLERPTSGQVLVDGEDLTKASKRELRIARRKIGMIFQDFRLLQQRTVEENVRFPLELIRTPKKEAHARVMELLGLVGLTEKAKSYPSALSGGQQQRVAIARALACRPKYLLCDEATSALDPATTRSVLGLLNTIHAELGVTIVVVTHEMRVVKEVCNKVAVLGERHIAECGLVSEVFSNPSSETARGLISPPETWREGA